MWMRLDSGRFPQMNYNRVIRQAKSRVRPDARPTFGITQSQVYGMWKVSQDVCGVVEPQLALRKPAYGQKRHGLI